MRDNACDTSISLISLQHVRANTVKRLPESIPLIQHQQRAKLHRLSTSPMATAQATAAPVVPS